MADNLNPTAEKTDMEKDMIIINRDRYASIENTESSDSSQHFFTNHQELQLAVYVGKMDVFNYALYENDIAPIRGIQIINGTGDPLEELSIRITSDFHFFENYEKSLPSIPSGKPIDLPNPHLVINGKELADLTESVNAEILIEIRKGDETLCGLRGQMQVLAYDQWQGSESYHDLLPAFVLPNHPVIPALMHDAAAILLTWGKSSSLEGYQRNDPNRVRDLAAAAYAAIQKKNIVYANPPASFSVSGQRIRTPETIMEQRLATCMDITLLYAALLEAIGLHPVLVVMRNHIFAGVWLKKRTEEELLSGDVVTDNIEQLTMRIGNGSDEMTFVECTAMCSDSKMSFEQAEETAKFENLNSADFEYAIDVYLSRIHNIKPIASRIKESGAYQIKVSEKHLHELTDAPVNLGITIEEHTASSGHKITNKRELWESKLLDLSTRNMLLNLPQNASIEPIMSSHIDELEDAISDGHEFNLLPAAEWIVNLAVVTKDENGKESKPVRWLSQALSEIGAFELTSWPVSADFDFNEKFRQEYRNHRLYTFCGTSQLEKELTGIYRAARASQQENGVSSLYLAVGLLRWFTDPASTSPCYAPLILVPIEIIRKSAHQGYALHARDEEPHFNTTLLEMLKQNFNIEISGLDPLPTDDHGTNIKKVFSIVRSALYNVRNWDVVETCVIGNFSFAQFAMWNDIHTAGEMLDNSKIVRSMIKGHVDWDISVSDNDSDENVYLPITVDDTQLKAIQMAAKGTTFVLHGPPGTGKSQTITGMIANLMAQGKRVLFVAEKMAALSVVQRRLAALGIGDFCLELHSDKASKKQVLTQLNKALSIDRQEENYAYEAYQSRMEKSRSELDEYAEHLHHVHKCGYSLRELIALYETVRNSEHFIRFDSDAVGELTKRDMESHIPLIGQLTAAGEAINGGIIGNPLIGVGLTAYGADIRGQLKGIVRTYRSAITDIQESGSKLALLLEVDIPKTYSDFLFLAGIASVYQQNKENGAILTKLLQNNPEEAYRYFDRKENFSSEEELLLKDWKAEFLTMDPSVFLSKHETAGRKFFGKSRAMAQVTAELQNYACRELSFDIIPTLLQKVSEHQQKAKELDQAYSSLSDNTRALIREYPTREAYVHAYDLAVTSHKDAERFPGGLDAIMRMSEDSENNQLFESFLSSFNSLISAEKSLNELLNRKDRHENADWLLQEVNFCDYLEEHPSAIKDWSLYNQIRQKCVQVGLEPVAAAYENELDSKDLIPSYRKGLYYALINNIIGQDDFLSSFSGATFNESIAQFKKLDEAFMEQSKTEIFRRLASKVPSVFDSPQIGSELNLLRKAIGSNARGMSIRMLFDRIPHILPRLAPCMLMSPNSVAQYLTQDNDRFDVVIFDEASQLPTCKAVGALARAKNAVIVGDPKQMPPTTFFSGAGPEVEDLALDDLDSILDDALALGIPSQHLQWHYRSTHESLIAFSNHQFYENKMYTFPSANDRERHVTAVHVDALYSKGVNPKEAEAVVGEIIRRYKDPELQKESIGVVTFNVKQQGLIEDMLAKEFQNDAGLDAWANNGEDPLFVKNLENVQGDERDVILFSIGYGPDEKGRVSNNFGPINKPGGGKRLNVAFSRARVTMIIFSSIWSSDIRLTENSPEGLKAFHDFLHYAEGHDIVTETSEKIQSGLSKAGILQNICKVIEEHGFVCTAMVGHSDFRIDIAVVDPYDPTHYILGILLDGDGYYRTKNTKDRELSQISVLKHLGWEICRVWTIDWWDNRDREINKLLSRLDTLKFEAEKLYNQKQTAQLESSSQTNPDKSEQVFSNENDDAEKISVKKTEAPSKSAAEKETTPEKKSELLSDDQNLPDDNRVPTLLKNLIEAGAEFIDKRENGGALWVVGGKELRPIMKELKAEGISFSFKTGGGKATGGQDGWWTKNSVSLPIL